MIVKFSMFSILYDFRLGNWVYFFLFLWIFIRMFGILFDFELGCGNREGNSYVLFMERLFIDSCYGIS